MKNFMRRLCGNLAQVVGAILSTVMMYLCTYVWSLGNLISNDELFRSLFLPLIMVIPALVYFNIWFGFKAKKFTNGTYPDYNPKHYGSVLAFGLTFAIQYIVAWLITLPLFGFYMEVSIPMMVPMGICEVFLLVANALCYWVFKPIANEI